MTHVNRRNIMTAAIAAPFLAACSSATQEDEVTVTTSNPGVTAQLGHQVTFKLSATGGRPPYSWSAVGGGVPGLTLARDGKLSGQPTKPGNFWVTVQAEDSKGSVSSTTPVDVTVSRGSGSATADVLGIGTSLSAAISTVKPWTTAWPLLTQRQSRTWGWPGHDSSDIAARWGAVPYQITETAEIPSRGSVELTLDRVTIREAAPARIAGVLGTVNVANLGDAFSPKVRFTRAHSGKATRVPAGSELHREFDLKPYAGWTPVIEAARNDNLIKADGVERMVSNYEALLKHFGRGTDHPRAFLVGQPLAIYDDAREKRARIDGNDALKKAFPQHYLDPWNYLRSDECSQFLGIRWTDQDQKDIASLVTPKSLRLDDIHVNTEAHRAIAKFYQQEMTKRGWL